MQKRPRKSRSFKTLLLVCLLLAAGPTALAHLPRLVTEDQAVEVQNPEVSQAFYARLRGNPAVYEIRAPGKFLLYVNLLVPDLPGIDTEISARVILVGEEKDEELISLLDGENSRWEPFFEPFAGDRYLMGPEFEKIVPSGHYRIEVFSPHNTGRYVLAVGKREEFTLAETLHTIKTLPALKRDFFGKSPLTAFFNLVGLFMLITGAIFFVPLYFIARRVSRMRRRG